MEEIFKKYIVWDCCLYIVAVMYHAEQNESEKFNK